MAGKEKGDKMEIRRLSDSEILGIIEKELPKEGLDKVIGCWFNGILLRQEKGNYVKQKDIAPDVYVLAADLGYSTIKLSSGEIMFVEKPDQIIEDPESPFCGSYESTVPNDGKDMFYKSPGC